ncbi:hypothetical protein [Sporosarcina koreensis]|uniref:hypothetical protein n=1 Tax=Sporosarcina koreensis TaxID=334735 RepID=UPI000693D52C
MMKKKQVNERKQMEILAVEQLVPPNHLVRKLDAAIDFSFICPLVENLYSDVGRTSVDPVERVFADAKEKHGMQWTDLKGLKKLSM